MSKIRTKQEYLAICERIEELLRIVGNETPTHDKNFIELDLLSDWVADYEESHEPVEMPNLSEIIKLKMHEQGLNQKGLSELLGISTSRVSEYLTGKSEPTLKVAKIISKKLNIEPSIILGD